MKNFCLIILFFLFSCNSKKTAIESDVEKLKIEAFALYEKDNYEKALPYFTSLIKIDSTNGEYFFKRANCLSAVRKKDEAIEDNLKAIELNYRKDAAYYNIGLDYLFRNDSFAIFYFAKCLKENPQHSKALVDIEETRKRLEKDK